MIVQNHMAEKLCDGHEGQSESEVHSWRRKCGCIRTSEKLKKILHSFPTPPPPTPLLFSNGVDNAKGNDTLASGYCFYPPPAPNSTLPCCDSMDEKKIRSTSWQLVAEVVQLVQLSVTATALALYYLIYCYMQLVYYTLRSALYFHNADGPMKITIGVVTVTSLVVGFNLLLRLERLIGLLY